MNDYTRTPRASRRNRKSGLRRTLLVVCMMLVVMVGSIAGTVAWLTAKTTPVTNTFTVGDINIALAETTGNTYHMIPGMDTEKDPTVTVKAGSEACYVFVKVEAANLPTWLDYSIDTAWTPVEGVDNVYYKEVAASNDDQSFSVLSGNKVTVSNEVTKSQVDNYKTNLTGNATLTFTAYAIQKENVTGTMAEIWALASAN